MARNGDGIYKRGKTWRLDFIHEGKRHVIRLGSSISKSTAKEIAMTKRAAILKGEAGIGRKRQDLSFERARELYLEAASIKPNTRRSYEQALNQLSETISPKLMLGEISAFLIEKHRQRRIANGAPVAFNRELGTLKSLFNWCIDKGKFEGANPCRKVKRIRESHGNERYLEEEEEERLLAACSEPLRTIILCGIYVGLRIPSEVLSLKWEDIDLGRGFLTVQGAFAKNGETETLPLNPKVRDALARLKTESKSEYVFTKKDGQPFKTIQNIFRTAAKRAHLPDISPHGMRGHLLSETGASIRRCSFVPGKRLANLRQASQRTSTAS